MNPLFISELFTSIQGESSFAGFPTTFIRLAGCNLRCAWCDSAFARSPGTPSSLQQLVTFVAQAGLPYVCITGGEPLMQPPVHDLMATLCGLGYTLSLETNGSLPINAVDARVHIILDVKCPKSGESQQNFWQNLRHLHQKDQVKFVICNADDYTFAKNVCEQYGLYNSTQVLFSPAWGEIQPQELIAWIINDRLPVRCNLQLHKYVWGADRRGV